MYGLDSINDKAGICIAKIFNLITERIFVDQTQQINQHQQTIIV